MKLFVGSYGQKDQEQKFLDYINASCTGEIEVRFLRYQDNRDWVTSGWRKNYESLKFAIPEICNFKGRAIYLEVSCMVKADLNDLLNEFNLDIGCQHAVGFRTELLVFDCSKFKSADWPYILKMKRSGDNEAVYLSKLVTSSLNDFGKKPEWLSEKDSPEAKIVRDAIPFRTKMPS